MFSIPIPHNPEQWLLNGSHFFTQGEGQHRFLRTEPHYQHSVDSTSTPAYSLESLINAFRFRHFQPYCESTYHQAALHLLKTPSYRYTTIKKPAPLLNRLLRDYAQFHHNPEKLLSLPLNVETKQLAVYLANHSPFIHHKLWFDHFSELSQLCADDFIALLCATLIHQTTINKTSSSAEIEFFYQGVCSGYINLQMAKRHELHPLHSFMSPLIHYVSLIHIHRELGAQPVLPNSDSLMNEINDISQRLSYWIAKDWGISDPIAHVLRDRFLNTSPKLETRLLETSEHAYLSIHLYQTGLLNRRQTQAFLKSLQLSDYQFLEAIVSPH